MKTQMNVHYKLDSFHASQRTQYACLTVQGKTWLHSKNHTESNKRTARTKYRTL